MQTIPSNFSSPAAGAGAKSGLRQDLLAARPHGGVVAAILLLHLVAWCGVAAVAHAVHAGAGVATFGIGIGVTAYMLGARHAFDADHIAAIDNTTRKLIQQGQRPGSVGFWFSLGHSTIVFVLTFLLALGVKTIASSTLRADSMLHAVAGLLGTLISSCFLFIIAAMNIVFLIGIWRAVRRMRASGGDAALLEQPAPGGLMQRLIGHAAHFVSTPRQMYLVGVLFGLGFDTATEVGLLVLAASSAASGLPWYAVLCLPLLFAAGMSLFDTLQGSVMCAAYGWAIRHPLRRIYYNLVVTALSVIVALIIGAIEMMGLAGQQLALKGGFWNWLADFDINRAGFVISGLLLASWVFAVLIKYAAPKKMET